MFALLRILLHVEAKFLISEAFGSIIQAGTVICYAFRQTFVIISALLWPKRL